MQEKQKNESADLLKSAEAQILDSMVSLREKHGVDITIAHSMLFMASLTTMKKFCINDEQFDSMFEGYLTMAQERFSGLKRPTHIGTETRQ